MAMASHTKTDTLSKGKTLLRENTASLVMAPAILANSKTESKNFKVSKQNLKKMDPGIEPEERKSIDLAVLKEQLSSEDLFITSLLTNLPKQGVSLTADSDNEDESNDEVTSPKVVDANRATDPEELKERLAAKLAQFKGKRLEFSEKRMKTKLKKKLYKLEKKKLKKKNNKMKLKLARLAQATKGTSATSTSPTETIKTEVQELTVPSRPPKPIFNSEGRMVFSKFDFGELSTPSSGKKTLDPKAALLKIKKEKEKVKLLESKGKEDVARKIEEKRAWQNALQRAEGIKVKDNEALLTKSLKKKEKLKSQSKKKWNERIEAQEKRQEDQQKKRKANIAKKKNEKKDKKLNRLAKKGKFIV